MVRLLTIQTEYEEPSGVKPPLTSSGSTLAHLRPPSAAIHTLDMPDRLQILKLSATDNGDNWEWDDDHLYLDISRTPIGVPDPPVDANLEQIQEAWTEGLQSLVSNRHQMIVQDELPCCNSSSESVIMPV